MEIINCRESYGVYEIAIKYKKKYLVFYYNLGTFKLHTTTKNTLADYEMEKLKNHILQYIYNRLNY